MELLKFTTRRLLVKLICIISLYFFNFYLISLRTYNSTQVLIQKKYMIEIRNQLINTFASQRLTFEEKINYFSLEMHQI